MDNKTIIKLLKKTVALMELHDENEFKIKSYNSALFQLERFDGALENQTKADLEAISGVGKSIASAIDEINTKGQLTLHDELESKTPEGILEIMELKGVGAKKIKQLWQEMDITSIDQLFEIAENGELAKQKGFGAKTAENIKAAILLRRENEGKLLYAQAEPVCQYFMDSIKAIDDNVLVSPTGSFRRKMEIVDELTFLLGSDDFEHLSDILSKIEGLEIDTKKSSPFSVRAKYERSDVIFLFCGADDFQKQLFLTTGSPEHLAQEVKDGKSLKALLGFKKIKEEKEAYELADLPYIAPELREGTTNLDKIKADGLPKLIEMEDLKGILHNHSTYSDGQHTLAEMAQECQRLGYEYLGITDHSKSSFYYANGLYENRVADQQVEIDELNANMAPFKIFKGIECDILPDGSLDYSNDVLASFDFIVSSIHSAMSMDKIKATERVLKAVENPFTTILGHMTGRLLLKRPGYPVDHAVIIEACAKNNVAIEINANPWRLDIDWRWINYAIEKGVMLSINPDAHKIEGYADMYYGLQVGRKGGLTKVNNLNSLSLKEIDEFFTKRKANALSMVS
ncbi:DNA polymerase/3'-5' exonuclease PolX [Fulvivirga sp.]|uniref:DNA polymerase/3'-5' exonuclease PolX n=1 Tax=Fulvivirga sp. TaxID=1931237 RepID=UPI0032F04FEC